jgi:FRG domain
MGFSKPVEVGCIEEFEREIVSFRECLSSNGSAPAEIVFRGLADKLPLTTTLERTIELWDVANTIDPAQVERGLIREFRRGYQGQDAERVLQHTCYCLALMQHHGAPTRMLDWTYSPYIAAKFALDKRRPRYKNSDRTCGVVWCLDTNWLRRRAAEILGEWLLDRWDAERSVGEPGEELFRSLFMSTDQRKRFVLAANPFGLNERLKVQQGLFLCQGDVTQSFVCNLKGMHRYEDHIKRIRLVLKKKRLHQFATELWRRNMNSASLSLGLDGYAKSLGENPLMFSK